MEINNGGGDTTSSKWAVSLEELKKVSYVAAPMAAVTVFQFLLQVVSVMMVGHLDELSLSGASMATSFTAVTGFSLLKSIGYLSFLKEKSYRKTELKVNHHSQIILFGMAGALETLCGQAYGAEQYKKLGSYTYCGTICLLVVCIPISILWMFTDKLLVLIGQDPSISSVAQHYALYLIPNLFAYAVLQALTRYFQAQSLILPMLLSSFASLLVHVPLCWVLVFRAGLGYIGAAIATSIASWLYVVSLGLYMKYSPKCDKTRCPLSKDVLSNAREFLGLAVPSATMACLEWWSYEVIILLSGLLPNPKLETSVLSICFTMTYLHYYVVYGVAATTSIRVSNELGADNPRAAKLVVWVVMALAITEVIVVCSVLLASRHFLGYLFSSDREIVKYVEDMAPFICLCMIMDALQAVLNGVVRGSGWQRMGAYVNLGAYYLVGTPVAALLAFVVHLRGKGLLIGLASGSCVQAILLGGRTLSTNWQKQASITRERIFRGDS